MAIISLLAIPILQRSKLWLWEVYFWLKLMSDWLSPVFSLSSVSFSLQNSLCLHPSLKMVFLVANQHATSFCRKLSVVHVTESTLWHTGPYFYGYLSFLWLLLSSLVLESDTKV